MSYAHAWLEWFPVIEKGAARLNQRMLQLAELEHSKTVFDIGTGIGEPALSSARRLGPEGHVVAIDRDSAMIEYARQRATRLGITNVEFEVADIDDFVCPEPRFDVIFARWSLMFATDLEALLRRLSSFLRPGGGWWRRPGMRPKKYLPLPWHGVSPAVTSVSSRPNMARARLSPCRTRSNW